MKQKQFSGEQIIGVLKEHEAGGRVDELCRRHGVGMATFHARRKKYAGMEASDPKIGRAMQARLGLSPFAGERRRVA